MGCSAGGIARALTGPAPDVEHPSVFSDRGSVQEAALVAGDTEVEIVRVLDPELTGRAVPVGHLHGVRWVELLLSTHAVNDLRRTRHRAQAPSRAR